MKKDWWTTALIVTTLAHELNKAHVKYLESRLAEQARVVGSIMLDNGNTPPNTGQSAAGKSNMEEVLDTLFIFFPALGVDMFSNKRRPAAMASAPAISTSPRFVLEARRSGRRATAVLNDGELRQRKINGSGQAAKIPATAPYIQN